MTDKLSFKDWEKQCDRLVAQRVGFGIYCLPDVLWLDMYDDGLEPIDAIEDAYYDQWQDYIPAELWAGEYKL
jgi:hypothetical protein|tara:strand:- start:1699 stop:1914 length:216 start_codon:yes stop_codon:yes gene_type:complete